MPPENLKHCTKKKLKEIRRKRKEEQNQDQKKEQIIDVDKKKSSNYKNVIDLTQKRENFQDSEIKRLIAEVNAIKDEIVEIKSTVKNLLFSDDGKEVNKKPSKESGKTKIFSFSGEPETVIDIYDDFDF